MFAKLNRSAFVLTLTAAAFAVLCSSPTFAQGVVRASPGLATSAAGTAATVALPPASAPLVEAPVASPIVAVPAHPATAGRAPTIDALDAAQRREYDADVRKRFAKTLEASNPPVAAVPAAASASAVPAMTWSPPVEHAPPADTRKTVVAIYGPVGEEVADIRLPDDSIVTVTAGADVAGFAVVRVTPQAVELLPRKDTRRFPKRTNRRANSNGAAVDGALPVVRVAVGGSFK